MTTSLSRISLLFGLMMGVILLYAVAPQSDAEKRFEELALGEVNTVALGSVAGIQVHCHDLDDIDQCLSGYAARGDQRPVALWLGNSQVGSALISRIHHQECYNRPCFSLIG